MSTTSLTPAQTIRQIDRHIDGIRMELYRRGCRPGMCASSWQLAWDRNPDLRARNETLFRLRGLAQLERDAQIEREYRAEQRRTRRSIRRAA